MDRTIREAWADNIFGLSAQLAYYFFFSLFPALLLLIAAASYFPKETLVNQIFASMSDFAPPDALRIITDQITKITAAKPASLLTFGMAAALWSSSSAMSAIISTLNSAYDVEDGRPWWQVQLTAIALTLGVAAFILISFGLVIVGPTMADTVSAWLHLGSWFAWTWKILQWPLVFVLASVGIGLIYYFAPDVEQQPIWLMAGSMFATTLWLATSLAFKYYVVNISSYAATYGIIGSVMVLMLWFYISGAVILVGAEMNAEIEHTSARGKQPGEKVPGQRRIISTKAMRAWIHRRRSRGEKPPSAEEVKAAAEKKPLGTETMEVVANPASEQDPPRAKAS
jgi:membrane protein